jgi:hypothetical protein
MRNFYNNEDLVRLAAEYVKAAEKNAAENPTSDLIQVVVVEPMKKPYKKTIKNDAAAFNKEVGGYFEIINIGQTERGATIAIHLNEEGKLIGLPFNRRIIGFDVLVGTFFISAYNMEGENITLSNPECEKLIKRFTPLEVYVR